MTSLLFSLMLGILAGLNRRIGGSWLYPPAIFAAVWSALLLGLTISGESFYPVSTATYLVYLTGATSFSAGGLLSSRLGAQAKTLLHVPIPCGTRVAIQTVKAGAIALLVCFPWYWQFLQDLSVSAGYSNIWIAIRVRIVALSDTQWTEPVARWDSVLFSNVVTFAGLLALIGVAVGGQTRGERFLVKAQVFLALVFSVLTASTAGAASLLGAILGIRSIKQGRLKIREATLTMIVFILVFATVAVTLGKGRTSPSASLSENVKPAMEVVQLYTLGGLVAFDRVVQDPSSIRASWSISRFFLLTANKLGATFDVPPLHAEYTQISPNMSANVYTIYFSYFRDYGWTGVILLAGLLGAILTRIYVEAMTGSHVALVLYGFIFSGLLLSGFSEQFFLALNTLLKAAIVAWLVFSLPRRFGRRTTPQFESNRLARTVI